MDAGSSEWCSAEQLQSGPYIQLNFTEPVVVSHMRARGDGVGFSIQSVSSAGLEQYEQPNGVTVR